VAEQTDVAQLIARRISQALATADLSAYADLLHPDVRWGAPGDPAPPCQSRGQVLAWYQRGWDAGTRAQVIETVAAGDKILVGLRVTQAGAAEDGEQDRWQVLTLRDGRIADIRGYELRAEAAASAGLAPAPADPCVTRWAVPAGPIAADDVELRLPVPADATILHDYAAEPGGLEGAWLPLAAGTTLAGCEALIADWLAGWQNAASQHGPALAIQRPGQAVLIGQVWLADRGDRIVELGYGVAPAHRRRGYASRAARLAPRWLLDSGHAEVVELRIGQDNLASQRTATAAGFTPAGTVRCHVAATGHTYDDLRFILAAG
jgi:RimJ/RimL family protein N-acetyltransferase/ketosteroid isomerase-like protein